MAQSARPLPREARVTTGRRKNFPVADGNANFLTVS